MSATSTESECDRIEQVWRYASSRLPQTELPDLQQHLSRCVVCQRELAAVRPVFAALRHWPTDLLQPSVNAWERLSKRIAAERGVELEKSSSSYVAPSWHVVAPGIACKILSRDRNRQRVSMLVRLEPGHSYPPHQHAAIEELHLLEGELWIDDRKLRAGDYNKADAGTIDKRVWSETGCMCVLITSSEDALHTEQS
jgi:quercetin dioxygenase-like cupin family protein